MKEIFITEKERFIMNEFKEGKRLEKFDYVEIKGPINGKEYDLDRYEVDFRSLMASHECAVVVDHLNKRISGDAVRYGSWDDLMPEECLEILELVEEMGELRRPYKDYIKKEEE
jgi:hypothetical protein